MRRLCAVILWMVWTACPSVARQAENVSLSIGADATLVTEVHSVPLVRGRQVLVFHNIPAEADLTSLILRSPRIPIVMKSWGWLGTQHTDVSEALVSDAALSHSGENVIWQPRDSARSFAPVDGLRSVECTIQAPLTGERPVELIYLVKGIRWRSHYQILVRGWKEEGERKLSVDFNGVICIENRLSLSFPDALVRLIGSRENETSVTNPPGFLILDPESALADMWKDPLVTPEIDYVYALPERVDLPAHTEQLIDFVSATRVPASRRYVMNSDEFPLLDRGELQPLPRFVVLDNSVRSGLGFVLPPGPVDVFPGGVKQYLMTGARIPHTPVNSEVRIDMGSSSHVRGGRH